MSIVRLSLNFLQAASTAEHALLRNFNSPDRGDNLRHIKHQAKTNLIKSVATGEPTKLLRRRSNCKLGNTKSKCSRHILTTFVCVFFVCMILLESVGMDSKKWCTGAAVRSLEQGLTILFNLSFKCNAISACCTL